MLGCERTRLVRFDVLLGIGQVTGDVPMGTDAKWNEDTGADTSLNVQVNTNDGRLLEQFTLAIYDDDVRTLGAAERIACKNRSYDHGKLMVIVVSEKTSADLS